MLMIEEEEIPIDICACCFSKRQNLDSFFHLCSTCEVKIYPETSICTSCNKEVELKNFGHDQTICMSCETEAFELTFDNYMIQEIDKYTRQR